MARTNTIDSYFTPIKQEGAARHTFNEVTIEQNKVSYTICSPAVPSSNRFCPGVFFPLAIAHRGQDCDLALCS